MEKISKEIPSREEIPKEELLEIPEELSMDGEGGLGKEESAGEPDVDKRLREAMEGRIVEANEKIADLTKKLEGRDLNSVPEASVDHANELEDKRDALQKQLDAKEISNIEYARGIAPLVEALAKIIEAWERTTKGQMLEKSKE